jgi:hypothetical protein
MSQENIELVRRAFDDWNRGVREIRADDVDPEMELHSRMIGRVLRGVDGLRTWFTEIDEQFDAGGCRSTGRLRRMRMFPDRGEGLEAAGLAE